MVAVIRLATVVAASVGLAQGARKNIKRHDRRQGPDMIRLVQGGAMTAAAADSPAMEAFRNRPPKAVKYITAASPTPEYHAQWARDHLMFFGANDPEWIPIFGSNCAERTRDQKYVQMVEEAEAVYMIGGQSGRVSSCLFGNYSQRGINSGERTPLLKALQGKLIVGGSSAGAMTQPMSEILVTGHSRESYDAVSKGQVYMVNSGNDLLGAPQGVDTHFSERGRQGRLLVFAMQTKQEWAFGVDESTAYIWRPSGKYEVTRGAAGVVVFQGATGDKNGQEGRMHYLTGGDVLDINTGIITYGADKRPCSRATAPKGSKSVFDSRGANIYKDISIATAQAPVGTKVVNTHGYRTQVQVAFTKDERTVAMCGPEGDSFENLLVQQAASATLAFDYAPQKPNIDEHYIYELDD